MREAENMNETSKTRKIWGAFEQSIIKGTGIDIGCGNDPLTLDVRRFDIHDGDANCITKFVNDQFDFVYSSHCLEHMVDPRRALLEWWQLVKPGGYLLFIVPDEDLYEQGVFPSRFNPDHKSTFTIAKAQSWSPVSLNVLELAKQLPEARIIKLELQDHNYDRCLYRHANDKTVPWPISIMTRVYRWLRERGFVRVVIIERIQANYLAVDQTLYPNVLAQIQCILQKTHKNVV